MTSQGKYLGVGIVYGLGVWRVVAARGGSAHARARVSVTPPSLIGVVPAHSGSSPPSRTFRPPPSPSRLFPALPARPGGKRVEYDREVPKKICPDVPPLSLRGLSSGRFPRGNPESRKVGVAGGVAASLGCGSSGGLHSAAPPDRNPVKWAGRRAICIVNILNWQAGRTARELRPLQRRGGNTTTRHP